MNTIVRIMSIITIAYTSFLATNLSPIIKYWLTALGFEVIPLASFLMSVATLLTIF